MLERDALGGTWPTGTEVRESLEDLERGKEAYGGLKNNIDGATVQSKSGKEVDGGSSNNNGGTTVPSKEAGGGSNNNDDDTSVPSKRGKEADGGSNINNGDATIPTKKRISFKHLDQTTIPFFFANFPESVSITELWKMFARFGSIE